MATPVILDVDTGIDDAVAMMFASSSRRMEIKAVTTSFGNSGIDNTTLNTLKVMELLGMDDVPVARGAKKGMLSPLKAAQRGRSYVGEDGMLGLSKELPYPKRSEGGLSACQLMEQVVSDSPNKVIFICLGPLTNIAVFLLSHPELKDRISGIVITGGAISGGDVLPTVEFNIAADPEAAQIVLSSGLRIMVCGLDVMNRAYLTFDEIEKIYLNGGKVADSLFSGIRKLREYWENTRMKDGCILQDPVSVAWLLDPSIFKCSPYRISVDLTGRYTRGTTVCAPSTDGGPKPNAMVATDIDREAFVKMLTEAFSAYGSEE